MLQTSSTSVYDIVNTGIWVHDVRLTNQTQVSPVKSNVSPIQLQYGSSVQQVSANTNSFFWKEVGKACATAFSVSTYDYTPKVAIAGQITTYNFDFVNVAAKKVMRLCVSLNDTSWLDFENIRVYPVDPALKVSSGAMTQADNIKVTFQLGSMSPGGLDQLWFRRNDQACQSTPPTPSTRDKYETAAFTFATGSLVVTVSTSHIELSEKPFRLCTKLYSAVAPQDLMDYESVYTYVVKMDVSPKACTSPCTLVLVYNTPSFVNSASDLAWWQIVSQACYTQASYTPALSTSAWKSIGVSGAGYQQYQFASNS